MSVRRGGGGRSGGDAILAAGASVFVFLTRGSPGPDFGSTGAAGTSAPDYHAVLVDEDNPLRVLVGTHDGVYESSDGGQTWQRTTPLAWMR